MQEEMGEGGILGRITVGWFSVMKWRAGARTTNSISLAPASFWYWAEGRGSLSGYTTFRFGGYSEIPIPFWSGIHTDIGELTFLCYHYVSSWGREDMIPRLPKHFHKLKWASWESDNKLVTVWPGSLFLGTTDRKYIWKWKLWPPILTSYLQGQQESL